MASPDNSERNSPSSGEGLSLLDLEHLPRAQVAVMRAVMREGECSHAHLLTVLTPEYLSYSELTATVQDLLEQQWLILAGERYRPNLRRKTTRILSEFQNPKRGTGSLRGIWESIESGDE